MKGVSLKFYFYDNEMLKHHLLYEWLLELAKNEGFAGGFVTRGIAGFGHRKKIHEEHFFELGSIVPIEVQFTMSEKDAKRFLNLIKSHGLGIFYTQTEIEYGHI
jgi:PII-like signaling protein